MQSAATVAAEFSGIHSVVDAAAREWIDDPRSIPNDDQPVGNRTVKGATDGHTADNVFDGFSVRELLFHEPLKIVFCPVPFPALLAGDPDPHICCPFALREYPEISFWCNLIAEVKDRGMGIDVDIGHHILDRAHDLPVPEPLYQYRTSGKTWIQHHQQR